MRATATAGERHRWRWSAPAVGTAVALLLLLGLFGYQLAAEHRRAALLQRCTELRDTLTALQTAAQQRTTADGVPAEAATLHDAARQLRDALTTPLGGCVPAGDANELSAALGNAPTAPGTAAPQLAAVAERVERLRAAAGRSVEVVLAAEVRSLRAAETVGGAALVALAVALVALLRTGGERRHDATRRRDGEAPRRRDEDATRRRDAGGAPRAGATPTASAERPEPSNGDRRRKQLHQLEHDLLAAGERERRLADAQRLAQLGHWSWEPLTGHVFWSDELYALLEVDRRTAEPSWRSFVRALPPASRDGLRRIVRQLRESAGHTSVEHRVSQADGSERVVVHRVASQADTDGRIVRLYGALLDITERKQAEEGAQRLALFDALTELPNRRFFKHHVHKAVERAKRGGNGLAVMFIDLDQFKRINDTLGHGVGDELLRQAGDRLVQCVRGGDVVGRDTGADGDGNLVARLGGDEFTVLLTDVRAPTDVARVARRIIAAVAEPIHVGSNELFVTASVGLAVYPDDGDDAEQLLAHADAAMYEAKRQGKNTYQFFTAELHAAAFEKLQLERELRRAIERDQFELHYQPKVDVRTGKLAGLEALLRWRHHEWGMVPPGRFIPLAEELGLIVPIGDWVLTAACEQLAAWRKAGFDDIAVAINMAPPSFRKPHLAAQVAAQCQSCGVEPSSLIIEVTEGLLMHDAGATLQILRQLRELGVRLSIDDFGTGYSSLSYLQRLPISQIKIDQSFVRDVVDNRGHAAITRAIISLAHALDLETVAEGVETVAQARLLMRLGCDIMQGYYYARPLPADEIGRMLQSSPQFLAQIHDTTLDTLEFQPTR